MGVILVVGATGQLGRAIVTKLRTAGTPVRALARSATRLAEMHPGVDGRAVDLLDVPRLTDACRGVDQIIATANNNMGTGANSPARVDLAAYQNLCAAARTTGVRRLIYVSYRGIAQDAPVDIFRVKWYIEDVIRRSGVPHASVASGCSPIQRTHGEADLARVVLGRLCRTLSRVEGVGRSFWRAATQRRGAHQSAALSLSARSATICAGVPIVSPHSNRPRSSITRRQALAALASTAAWPLMSGCTREPATALTPPNEADALKLLDEIGNNLLRLVPETATSLGLDTGARTALRAQLRDRSAEGQQRIANQLRADLQRANAVKVDGLPHTVRTSVEVVRSAYATALEGFALPYGDVPVGGWRITPYVVIQNVGAYLDVPRFLDADHRVEHANDAEAYLARMHSYAKQLDGELGRMQAARGHGLVPPAFVIDKASAQITLAITNTRKGVGLVESIERRTKSIPGNWAERARAIAEKEIAPALERQLAELQVQRGVAKNEAGMWARPGGEEYYRWALKASTTTSMTPDEVHEMGRRELQQLHAQMDTILKGVGYSTGSIGARMQALAKDPKYQFAEGDQGRAEIMAFIQNRLDWIRAQMPRAFNTVVTPNMEVKRLPPEEEPGAPAAYGGAGSIDGKIPGRFWINLRTTDLHSKYSLADLTFHEAIPGHIWQGEYTHEMPLVRQLLAFNAYSEGWALYAEQLADELGAFADDPVGRLGYLQSLAFRACRLVVDTGLHAKRWTREQGVQFFVDVNGSNPLEVASEVDRYCSWPGQACGYKVGHSEITRQREKAKNALGTKYDVKAFNDTVVKGGNVPLDVLGKNVDEYIRTA